MIKSNIRRVAIRALRASFGFGERLGVHVTPVHYYQPVPDTRGLLPALWARPTEMVGVDMNPAGQLELLLSLAARFRPEYDAIPMRPTGSPLDYFIDNKSFESVDGDAVLHDPRLAPETHDRGRIRGFNAACRKGAPAK